MAASEHRWPSLGYESQLWTSKYAEFGAASGPVSRKYKSSVPPFIAKLAVPISSVVAALAEDATEQLIRFDSSLGGEIAPFASLLLRSEAVASSRIENLTANARSILTAELGDTSKPNATIIAANTKAMRAALDLAGDLTPSTVLKMHRALMEGDPHHPAGEWRQEPIWIGTSALSPVGATYVGPDSARIPRLMDDVMDFARRDDIPRLVQAAVAHAQFETVHPFTDGNGRTGRALIQAMLRGKGLTNNVTVPVSAGLLTNTESYHTALTSYREGDLEPLIVLMAEASIRAAENAAQLVQDVHTVQQRWRDTIRARSNSGVWKVADLLARQPVLNAAAVAEHLGIAQANAYTYLRSLEDQGILKSKSEYKLGKLWRSDEILGVLDEFATRSGRRGYGQRG